MPSCAQEATILTFPPMPARRFIVKEKTFGLHVHFQVGGSQAAALRQCAKYISLDPAAPENEPDDSASGWAFCDGSWAYIWLDAQPDKSCYGLLVHELYHVVAAFLTHVETHDEEVGAYIQQYLFEEATKRLGSESNGSLDKLCRQWRKCAEGLHAALCYFAPNLQEDDGFTAEKDAVKEFKRLSEANE